MKKNLINFQLNGVSYVTEFGNTILQASLLVGIEIPKFCYHEKLSIAGNCRMCLVEISNPRTLKPVASCALPIVEKMSIFTNTILVKKAREGVLEFLLANHPLDCPICDQGGECDLQDQSIIFGSDRGRFYEDKRVVEDKECGPIVKTTMTRCIHCTRCIRFINEVAGIPSLGILGRGNRMEIGLYIENFIDSEFSGNLVDLCPVGALTSKPYSFMARPWELRSTETIDIMDSFCSRIRVDLRGIEIMRILPSSNDNINEDWISDRTRFSYDGLKRQRFSNPILKFLNVFIVISWYAALYISLVLIDFYDRFEFSHKECRFINNVFIDYKSYFNIFYSFPSNIFFFIGELIDIESCILMKDFTSSLGFSNLFVNTKNYENLLDFRFNFLLNMNLSELEKTDFCCLINLNPRLELPLLNLRLRKSFLYNNLFLLSIGYITNLTYSFFQLSNSSLYLLKFFEGRLFVTNKIIFSMTPLILIGENFLKIFKNINFFWKLNKFIGLIKSNWFGLNFINKNAGLINMSEIGFNFNVNFELLKRKIEHAFVYSLGNDINILSLNNNIFIYQGHNGDNSVFYADLILPSASFMEKNATFLNLEGRIQKSKFILYPPVQSRIDWLIINNLKFSYFVCKFLVNSFNNLLLEVNNKNLSFFELIDIPISLESSYNKNFYNSVEKLYEKMNQLIPNFFFRINNQLIFFDVKFIVNLNNTLLSFFNQLNFFNNLIFLSNNLNHYLVNSSLRSSKIMSLCGSHFSKKQYNFEI